MTTFFMEVVSLWWVCESVVVGARYASTDAVCFSGESQSISRLGDG